MCWILFESSFLCPHIFVTTTNMDFPVHIALLVDFIYDVVNTWAMFMIHTFRSSFYSFSTVSYLFQSHVRHVCAVRSRPGIDPGTVDAASMRSAVGR